MTHVTIKLTMTADEAAGVAFILAKSGRAVASYSTIDTCLQIGENVGESAKLAVEGILGDFVWVSDSIGDDDDAAN